MTDKLPQQDSYVWGMNRALEFIQANLGEAITLEDIAKEACLSKFHFHRIFKMVTKESLGQFIQRLRVEKAANTLCNGSAASLTEIALHCGYASSGYFSRAFNSHFGMSASAFRGLSPSEKHQFLQERMQGLPLVKSPLQTVDRLDVCMEEIPELHVAYVRKCYMDLQEEPVIIHRMFDYITAWGQSMGLMAESTRVLGIIYDNPYQTALSNYQYDACITVPVSTAAEGMVGTKTVAGGRYAILKLRNVKPSKLEGSIYTLLLEWLPKSGCRIDDRPILEFYYGPPSESGFTMDFCIPVTTDRI
ncbi:AraC family transcriptional regulator [Paenibacillus hexagrammi]|uniref:AraC family transcriptional regulator n=1 Tax=Paenibacillus hexagrammi TaxID=2908839 RepID=A0ABY3SHY3_9BACL|nr:AraC family transcriptional regulator [Paenibacillus sp. YPD9-1]UJF33378.1 AraC family transcriptional regulator [Paenibacillus sp. YPD9-1]